MQKPDDLHTDIEKTYPTIRKDLMTFVFSQFPCNRSMLFTPML